MAVKDGEAPKLHHVTSETTAEAFATAAAGPRMEKHHGKKSPPGRETPSIEPQNFLTSLLKP